MPATVHVEHHFTASDSVRDVVIGMADGLTVPFALAAGLSGAEVGTRRRCTCRAWPRLPPARSRWASAAFSRRAPIRNITRANCGAKSTKRAKFPKRRAAEVARDLSRLGPRAPADSADRRGHQRRRKTVGRFHDAIRTGPRGTGPQARGPQRRHYRRIVRRAADSSRWPPIFS